MGMPGMTAYVGLLRIGQIVPGETVFVSGAGGAVGTIACQIAKIKGCRIIASAGSDEKIAWLKEHAQIDHGINYKKAGKLSDALARACPEGINIYFDNVGGDHLEAALLNMANFGRIVACGMISSYNQESPPPGPSSIHRVVTSRLRIEGFIVFDHQEVRPAFLSDMSGWIREGLVEPKETIYEGLEKAPAAFIGLFKGENTGKMLVKVGPDPAVRI
jgi:NADPH-dependent curcumin reductase CurA